MDGQLELDLNTPTWKVSTRDTDGKIIAFEVEAETFKDARRVVRSSVPFKGAVLVQIK